MHYIHQSHNEKPFIIAITLNLAYVIFETYQGIYNNSSALLADAGHNFSDILALLISGLAVLLYKIKPNRKFTYGLKKATVLASLFNAILLYAALGIIIIESFKKLLHPSNINSNPIIFVALLGIIINLLSALLFQKSSKHDINSKALFWHLLSDALISLGVVATGIIIKLSHWFWLDGLTGIIISLIIVKYTWKLLTSSLFLSLDAVPQNIDLDEIKKYLLSVPNVQDVHHIHIWPISTTDYALTAHIIVNPDLCMPEIEQIKTQLKSQMAKLNLLHCTFEFEMLGKPCPECNI